MAERSMYPQYDALVEWLKYAMGDLGKESALPDAGKPVQDPTVVTAPRVNDGTSDNSEWADNWLRLKPLNEYLDAPETPAIVRDALEFVTGADPEEGRKTGAAINEVWRTPLRVWDAVTSTNEEIADRGKMAQIGPIPTGEDLYRGKRGVVGPMGRAGTEGSRSYQEDTKYSPPADEDDYLNQLMMAALMAGDRKDKRGGLGGAAGGGISFGDPWTMNAPWEKDYRYLS